MAVPTIYVKLISAWNAASSDRQQLYSQAASKLRLMVSGSAALPVSVLEQWKSITGQTLLERYGMTEIGMALSNPLHGERRPGFVGTPLPGVEVMLADEEGCRIEDERVEGEICIHGETVFKEYWANEEATRRAFRDGWFLTGDISVIEGGAYKILGRKSVDIIKSGGFKISALEIEEVLRTHPDIQECAVVGVPDDEWGERVSAVVIPVTGRSIALEKLRKWAVDKLAKYKIPSDLLVVEELPRNVMGKVMKPAVRKLFQR
jgi:malonyl-CoA/methylmalonyl-CoA synthetase